MDINDCLQFCSKIPERAMLQCSTMAGLKGIEMSVPGMIYGSEIIENENLSM